MVRPSMISGCVAQAKFVSMMMMPSQLIAKILGAENRENWKVLDIAAGHGMFGIMIARQNPNAQIYAQDWPHVLEVAKQNATKAGVWTGSITSVAV